MGCFGTTLAEVADPDLGTRFRYYLRTRFAVGRRKRRKLLGAWDVCQPCRRSGTTRMVVLCNLFSRDLSRREQRCDSGYAPSFSADNAVAQARCGHQDERRYRHSHPRLHIRSADLGWAIGVQPFLAGRYSPNGDRRTCDRRAGTHRLRLLKTASATGSRHSATRPPSSHGNRIRGRTIS